jgi:hypothetical protein
MFDRSRIRFHDKNLRKSGATFSLRSFESFDRVKSVALWSANIRKLAKDHKGYAIGKPRVSPLLSLNTSAVIRYLICVYASHFFAGRPYHFN